MSKNTLKKVLSVALFIVLLTLLGVYLYKNRTDFEQLLHLSPMQVTLLLLPALGACLMNCVYHRMILESFGLKLDTVDWLGVVNVSNALSLVLPLRLDLAFTAAYYKRVKGFSYGGSVSVAAGNVVFGVLFALLQMLVSLLLTGLLNAFWPPVLWLCWGVMTLCAGGFIAFSLIFGEKMPPKLQRIPHFKKIVDGFNALLKNRGLLLRLLICLTVNNLFTLVLYMMCFRAVGMEVSIDQALFYNSVSRLSSLVAIVPNNIGIKEAVMGAAGTLMGDVFNQGVAVSLLHSASLTVLYIVTGLLCAFPVWKKWHEADKHMVPNENK